MKKLDLFIIKKFLVTFFFILSTIMLIAIIFDVSEKIDDFMEEKTPIRAIILDYYLNFILFYGNLFSALLIFIAVIFFTSKMASNSEIVAILSGGISFYRLLWPYFIAATLLASLSLFLNHFGIPKANKDRLHFEERYFRSPFKNRDKDIHRTFKAGQIMYFESFNVPRQTGYKFSIEQWENNKLVYKLMSDYATWDSTAQKWAVFNYTERFIPSRGDEIVKTGLRLDSAYGFSAEEFSKRTEYTVQMMNYFELKEFIKKQRMLGSVDLPLFEIEHHQRTSYPMATYFLTLIGVAVSSRKVRGGIGLHLAIGLLIAVSYILLMKVTTVLATNAGFNAMIAVWIPNIIFGTIGVYMLFKAPK